ncbi:hypothetical protein HJC23_003781 [Cyclotella cryptica]|uniref:NAD-dependent epimerase/dehydratase domain-containing protein n=1 Tax=Cyclotella cryptica TaxID=29204 RepID=A0ABD3QTA3_9STRA|eukprot:CCRYP_002233-RA/>CCRYP_002233-RA protein AED:0.24 eAED:0.24 QI:0/-1/0/1/-1/1/1/0/578
MPTSFNNEENSANKPRRRPFPSLASMDPPQKLRTSDLSQGPPTPSHLEISDQDPSHNYNSASRSSSPLLRVLIPTTPRGFLFLSITLLFFLVTLFPYVKHRYYEEASRTDAPTDFRTKHDLGPHKKAHVFVKPGNVKNKHNDGTADTPEEVVSDEIKGGSSGKSHQEGVPPIKGLAYLTPAEFRDVRLSVPNESVLLTGGLGFIGSHVVDLLLHRGFKVTILDDESNGHNHNKFCREMVPNDITVVGDLPKFPTGEEDNEDEVMYFTHVIHLAAAISVAESMNDPDKYERINYGGSQKVLDWVRGYNSHVSSLLKSNKYKQQPSRQAPTLVRKIVAASSAAIYGDPDPALLPLREPTPYGGLSPYADTKYRMEGLMRGFVDSQNADNKQKDDGFVPAASATALRFFNVYGPRQDPKNPYSGVISLFLEMASNNRNITILGDGLMTRDFVYVKDVARAVVMALLQDKGEKEPASFSVYNVCTGTSITINTLAEQVKQSMGSSSEIVHLDPREGDIRDSRCNPGGAAKGMAFVAAVSQQEGLVKTADWFREVNGSRLLRERRGGVISYRRFEEQFYPELI